MRPIFWTLLLPAPKLRPSAWSANGLALGGLALGVLLVYANALGGVFQFDDYNVIVDLDAVHSVAAWLDDTGQGIRPLLKLSYLLNWLTGWGPAGFVAINVLVHLACVLVVYRLSQAWLDCQGMLQALPLAPWMAAALFAVHPANTEAVSYICGRSTSLMALLYLAGVWAHAAAQTERASAVHKLVPPLCFAMALAVKETAVTFPLALVWWDLSRGNSLKQALYRARWSWVMLFLAAWGFVANDAYRAAMERSLEFNSLAGNAATQLMALAYLVRQWALPLWLNIDPDLAVRTDFSGAWPGLMMLAIALRVIGLAWRKRPWLALALGWALLHWLPLYVVLPRLDVANDRQLYLAIWPLGLAVAIELQRALPLRLCAAIVALLLVASAALTVQRNRDYQSEIALWEQTASLSPDKSRVHNNLGYAYKEAGRLRDARHEFLRALQLDPGNVKARLNLRRMNAQAAADKAAATD